MKFPTFAFVFFCATLPVFAADGEYPAPAATMEKMYADHLAGKGVFLEKEKEEFWDFIFEADLVEVLRKKAWGFDPLFFGQDAQVEKVKTKTISEAGGNALVLVEFTQFKQPVSLIASLHLTDHGWRLANIVDPVSGVDLLHDLHTPALEKESHAE